MRRPLLLLSLLAPTLLAEGPEFEVASIKPFELTQDAIRLISSNGGGPGTSDPTHITRHAFGVPALLGEAFDVKPYQIIGLNAEAKLFSITAVVPEGATKDDVRSMWRNLLQSRFGLKYHKEQREFQLDELIVGPRGHKLVESTDPEPPPLPPGTVTSTKLDRDGKPILERPGLIMMGSIGPNGPIARGVAKAQPLAALANLLSSQLRHPVIDKTGLTGKYDFSFEFSFPGNAAPAANAAAAPAAPELTLDMGEAVQQQLGLRLVKGKGMLDVIVIEKVNSTPTEN